MNESKKEAPPLAHESYIAVALQPKVYGCRNRDDILKNMTNQTRLIDDAFLHAPLAGGGPVKLVAIPEGSLQGFWDETSHIGPGDILQGYRHDPSRQGNEHVV